MHGSVGRSRPHALVDCDCMGGRATLDSPQYKDTSQRETFTALTQGLSRTMFLYQFITVFHLFHRSVDQCADVDLLSFR